MYDYSHLSAVPSMLRIWPINTEWPTVSNAALMSSSTVSTPFFLSAELRWSFWIRTNAVSVLCMHSGKCPINRCCIYAGEVVLLIGDVPATLKQNKTLILAGICSSSLDPGLVSLLAL